MIFGIELHGMGAVDMVTKIPVVIVGVGRVGGALQEKVKANSTFLIRGLFTAKTYSIFDEEGKLTTELNEVNQSDVFAKEMALISTLPVPFILVDTSSDIATFPLLGKTLERGGYVVTANKKHFSEEQAKFDKLHALGADRLFFSTTVGAGLPIIKTIKKLVTEGAEIVSIKGILSGTLGFVFSEMDKGTSFTSAVIDAYERGFTEPHPKDDLSGVDVARKILILARVMGIKLEPSAINVLPLYSSDMERLESKDFLHALAEKTTNFTSDFREKRVRYLGSISNTPEGYRLETSVEEVDATSPFFNSSGPENVIVIQARGQSSPFVIRGAGAGIEITATRLYEDLCTIKDRLLITVSG